MDPNGMRGPNDAVAGFATMNSDASLFSVFPYADSHAQHKPSDSSSYWNRDSDAYYASPFIQQAPSLPTPVVPCVHINPNYRTKVSMGYQSSAPNRPGNVHINPHWKGRVDSAIHNGDNCLRESQYNQTVGKKTIFVNPKVLSQLHLKKAPPPLPSQSRPSPQLQCGLPSENTPISMSSLPCDASNSQSTEMNKGLDETIKNTVAAKCVQDRPYVLLHSRKLVRKTNASLCHKPSSFEGSKRSPTACTSTLKIARQVASKYKLVRSPSTNLLKTGKCIQPTYSRRSRRKIVNNRLSSVTNFKSVFKFIRQPKDSGVPEKQSVKAEKLKQLHVPPCVNTQIENADSLRRNLKSRYKLIKSQQSYLKPQTTSSENVKVKSIHSRYKLVRNGLMESKPSLKSSSMCSLSLYSSPMRSKLRSFNANRLSYGRNVSRFRIIQNNSSMIKNVTQAPMTDSGSRRSTYTKSDLSKTGLYKNISWRKERLRPSIHPKSFQPGIRSIKNSSQKNATSSASSKKVPNRSLVNIGGVLYRSTRTTLTRTGTGTKERILHIRGRRYVMDGKGKTIRPATTVEDGLSTSTGKKLFARVDIGGVTFTRRSDNTLVRTNTHYARNLLSLAKMRSIALLTDKLRKNNQPCLIYHRFGKCLSQMAGKCWRVHDPRNISICRKFLQGICDNENCLLSHDVGPEKMPTCRYFLEGCCVRDNCPYLHVKLSANAAICRHFLHGYCDAGDKCKKRHVFLCPVFEKDGKCSKGKYCPYPHVNSTEQKPKRKRNAVSKRLKDSSIKIKDISKKIDEGGTTSSMKEPGKMKRYYDESSPLPKSQLHPKGSDSDTSSYSDEDTEGEKENSRKKSKIGILPAYIPL